MLSLGSEVTAKSPTELSNSPFFQFHYSIICKITKELSEHLELYDYEKDEYQSNAKGNTFRSLLKSLFMSYVPLQSTYKLSSDFTTCRKPSSACLSSRGYVNIPNNKIKGNQPLDIGYYYSCIHMSI